MLDLRKLLSVGQNAMLRRVVQRSDTAADYSNDLNELLATPICVDMAIRAAIATIDQYLPEGFISIGSSIRFTHTAATSLGMTVMVRCQIIEVEEHEILLEIKAWDEQGDIGHGLHKRYVVDKAALLKKARQRTRFLTNHQI